MLAALKQLFITLIKAGILAILPVVISVELFSQNNPGSSEDRGAGNPEIVIQPTSFTVVIKPDTVLKFQMTVFNQGNDTLDFFINTQAGVDARPCVSTFPRPCVSTFPRPCVSTFPVPGVSTFPVPGVSTFPVPGVSTNGPGGSAYQGPRSVDGSTLTSDKNSYLPGESADFSLSLYNGSLDNEWLDTLIMFFPQGVSVNYATHFTGGTLGPLVFNGVTGNGVTVQWNDQNGSGGNILPGETAQGLINLSFDEAFYDTLALVYRIYGDNFGGNPHVVQDTLWLAPEDVWLIAEPETGTVPPGEQKKVDLYFNSGGYPIGYFTEHFLVESNDTSNPVIDVPVNLTVYPYSLTQTINIPAGWSGISTYVLPFNPNIEHMFDTVSDRVKVIHNFDGIYWPQQQINTLGEWNAYEGYVINATAPIQIKVTGLFDASQTVFLNEGWNILPVLSTQTASTFLVFRDIEEIIDVVYEINGPKMYWPSQHIYTLTQLVPGKSYFIRVTEPCYVVYPSSEIEE